MPSRWCRLGGFCLIVLIGIETVGCASKVAKHSTAYQSVGVIELDPIIPTPDFADQNMLRWQAYVATVVSALHSEALGREAMQDPAWIQYRHSPTDSDRAEWSKNLSVKVVPNSFLLNVTYTDDHEDGRLVAPIAVSALIHAYERSYRKDESAELERNMSALKTDQTIRLKKIAEDQALLNQVEQKLGGDIQTVFQKKYTVQLTLQRQVRDLEEQVRIETAEAGRGDGLAIKQRQLKGLQDLFQAGQKELDDFSLGTREIRAMQTEKNRLEEEESKVNLKLDELQNRKDMFNSFKVIDYGAAATEITREQKRDDE